MGPQIVRGQFLGISCIFGNTVDMIFCQDILCISSTVAKELPSNKETPWLHVSYMYFCDQNYVFIAKFTCLCVCHGQEVLQVEHTAGIAFCCHGKMDCYHGNTIKCLCWYARLCLVILRLASYANMYIL